MYEVRERIYFFVTVLVAPNVQCCICFSIWEAVSLLCVCVIKKNKGKEARESSRESERERDTELKICNYLRVFFILNLLAKSSQLEFKLFTGVFSFCVGFSSSCSSHIPEEEDLNRSALSASDDKQVIYHRKLLQPLDWGAQNQTTRALFAMSEPKRHTHCHLVGNCQYDK